MRTAHFGTALILGAAIATFDATAAVVSGVSGGTLTATSDASDAITIACSGGDVQVNGADPGTGAASCASIQQIVVQGGPGANVLSLAGVNLAQFPALTATTISGGAGNDTLSGSAIADILNGGADIDLVDGNAGPDVANLGPGDDTFVWNPGDGSDIVDGEGGTDLLQFDGSAGAEIFALAAAGARFALTRNVGNIVMDVGGVEQVRVNALGGADALTLGDLAGTGLALLTVDLAPTLGGSGGDAAADVVTLNGSAGIDLLAVAASGTLVLLSGSAVGVTIANAEAANDELVVNGLGGNDTISASGNLAALVRLRLDGGADDDTILGGNGADLLLGGGGDDTIDGNQGSDTAFLGAGNDLFVWDPGDGSDVVEGQDGVDRLRFNGSAGSEAFAVSPNGGRVLFARNVGSIVMDLDDIEGISLNALGGADVVTVNALDATDLVDIDVELAVAGAGDAAIDTVTLNGTTGNDVFTATPIAGGVELARLGRALSITGSEAANDVLVVDTSGGDDVLALDISATAGFQRFTYEAGAHGGLGDQLIVDGTTAAEAFTIAPNAARLALTRSGGGAVDANAVERLQLAAGSGADSVNTQGFATIAQVLDGGAPASFPGDVLMVSGFAGDPSVSPILIGGAQPIAHANFEFGPTGGRVRGRTYDDSDRDGVSDAGEAALAGLTVFDDANRNRRLDLGEVSAVTASDGTYELAFADEGSAVDVRVVPPAGRVQTNADPATIVLEGDEIVPGVDFGFTPGTLIEAFLTGWQETPPNASTATGYGHAALYEPSNEAVFVLDYSGLGSANTLTHVHGPAPRGVAAPPVIDLPASGATSGSLRVGPIALTAGRVAELKAGLLYFNVHTTTFPGGEIRGQLDDALFRDSFE